MFGLNVFQLLMIVLLAVIVALDGGGPQTQMINKPVVIGALLGLLLGDPQQGMFIGGTLQLMSMGVVGLGGASVPNYVLTTFVAVIVAIQSGAGYEIGLTVGLPVGMLYINLDVLHKILNGQVAAWSQRLANEKKFDKSLRVLYLGPIMGILKYLLPILIVLLAGQSVVQAIVDAMPAWLFNGMTVAGKILPVTGMAMLLNYMPVKKNFLYLCIGFVMYAYMGVPTLGVAIIGAGIAYKYYLDHSGSKAAAVAGGPAGGLEDE